MTSSLQVCSFTLTESNVASEHIYSDELRAALDSQDIQFVDQWHEADVVHLFEVNLLTRRALKAFQYPKLLRILGSETPLVVSTDDLYFSGDPQLTVQPALYGLNHRLQRWLFQRSDAIIAISRSVERNIAHHVAGTPIRVIHHGVDNSYRSPYVPTNDPFVLHVSLAAPRKNPQAIAEMARQLGSRFLVAGGGWHEHVPDRPGVECLGYVPEDELIDLYHRASVFYFPTLHEGFGLPVLEAMAASTAVVSSDVYSVPEVAGDAAVLHDPLDVDAHVKSIERLLENDRERERLSRRANERATEFTWEEAARKTATLYHNVVNSRL